MKKKSVETGPLKRQAILYVILFIFRKIFIFLKLDPPYKKNYTTQFKMPWDWNEPTSFND